MAKLNFYSPFEDEKELEAIIRAYGPMDDVDKTPYEEYVHAVEEVRTLYNDRKDKSPKPNATDSIRNAPAKEQTPPGKVVKDKLSPMDLCEKVLRAVPIRNINRLLICQKNPPLYSQLKPADLTEILRRLLPKSDLSQLKMSDYRGAYEYLASYSEIKLQELPLYSGCILFENVWFDVFRWRSISPCADTILMSQVKARFPKGPEETPYFDAFLNDLSGNDKSIQALVYAMIGYLLLPDLDAKVFFVLGTAPNSGKSLLARFLRKLLGEDLVSAVSLHEFQESFSMAPLVGKFLNISMDLNAEPLGAKAVATMKQLTGDDLITINEKYIPRFSYRNNAKFVFGTNAPLTLRSPDPAFWNRCIIIPCMHSVPEEEQDKELLEKIWAERNGVVYKAAKAAQRLLENNFVFPACPHSQLLKATWESDDAANISDFVRECCIVGPNVGRTSSAALFAAFQEYCSQNALPDTASKNSFSRILTSQFQLEKTRWKTQDSPQCRGFDGIILCNNR